MKWFYAGLVAVALIVLGQKSPKVAMSLAGLVLLSTIIVNKDKFKSLLDPNTYQ